MFPLPAPTGPHKTGRCSFHWRHDARDELETKAPDDKRELMVHVFYPAAPGAAGPTAVYVPDADAMAGPWSEAKVTRIMAMATHSILDAALPPGTARYPVAVFAPGGGMKGLIYHALLEDLASHGWVVAAIDPPFNARAVRFPDGRVLGNLADAERGWPRTRDRDVERRNYRERNVHLARDVSFVIDRLTALDRGDGPFAGRLDLQRGVGVFGHSRGGQAAGTARLLDSRVCCGINIDGTAGDQPVLPTSEEKTEDTSGAQPFLWIQTPLPPPPSDEQLQRARRTRADYDAEIDRVQTAWRTRLASIEQGALLVRFSHPGIAHIDFSDEPFWDGSMTKQSMQDKTLILARTRSWVRAFFEGAMRADWQQAERLVGAKDPHVTVERFGKLAK